MVYIYPTIINGTHHRSATYHTQELSNSQALCSDDKNLAYWGVKNPTWKGNYMRNWPDSLTSKSGSYYTPDTFKATGFSLKAHEKTKIKKISVEYKWEQISYSCGTSDCYGKFSKPVINLMYKGNIIGTTYGAAPEMIRYNNNKTNPDRINTNHGDLVTLHSHSFDISSYNLTAKDLQNIEVVFAPASNNSYNHLRIVMQFLRLNIDKEDYIPASLCQIDTKINKNTFLINERFEYIVNLKTTNGEFSTTNCQINIPDGLTIVDVEPDNNTKFDNNIWEVRQLNNEKKASIKLILAGTKTGEKRINAKLLNNADSINNNINNSVYILDRNITFSFKVNQNIFHKKYNKELVLNIFLKRTVSPQTKETIVVDTDGLVTQNSCWEYLPSNTYYKGDGIWEIPNIGTSLELKATVEDLDIGDYVITATHNEIGSKSITYTEYISVLADPLSKEYFKLKVEDGSDVQYNSLMFTEGDDLLYPLTYELGEIDNKFINSLEIYGETKRIPTKEARYIEFKLRLNTEKDVTYKNILTSIQVSDNSDIIIGADSNINIFKSVSGQKYFSINEISSNEEKTIKLIVQSEEEKTIYIHLNVLNKTSDKWIPAKVIFKDMPSIKLNIENLTSTNDFFITEDNNGEFVLRYSIQNLSNITGKDLKFKIEPPEDFNIFEVNYDSRPEYDTSIFDENSGIWYFNEIDKNDTKIYYIDIKYTAKKSNIYDFIIKTIDDIDTHEDDQHPNSFTYKMYINIDMEVDINTYVSNSHPYVNNIIDFTIKLNNYIKKQKDFKFQIMDIGKYNFLHEKCDYTIEYVDCDYGKFTQNTEDNNILGFWELDQIDINREYRITISLRPFNPGTHVIHTTFTNDKQQSLDFDNFVQVYNNKNKIDFDVHHAICDKVCQDKDCDNKTICDKCQPCDELVEICDEDFVTLGDKYYYRFNITNNDKNDISDLHVFCQIDESFEIDCTCPNITNIHFDGRKNDNLYQINIDKIKACSSIEFCFRVKPTSNGIYYSNFILTTQNAHILSKTLKMTVSNIYMERKLEHIITIYNTEKTHRYFRYELDGDGNLFKFFNTGDISKRLIDTEDYDVNKIETFKGSNLKELYRNIKQKSVYVEPELLRIGSNKLLNNGYELYPDGFMKRFGLLNSEVFHFAGQLPTITNLSQYAMRWDIDDWNTKVWVGDIYGNGVFDLTIDYDKIPTNFDIMQDTMNPVLNLQNIVEKTKPYGTKGLCHYNYNSYIDLQIDAVLTNALTHNTSKIDMELDKLGLISLYDRDDNSIAAFYDLFNIDQNIDLNLIPDDDDANIEVEDDSNATIELNNIRGHFDYLKPNVNNKYIENSFDTLRYKYYQHSDRTRQNIDIIKKNNTNKNDITNEIPTQSKTINIDDEEIVEYTITKEQISNNRFITLFGNKDSKTTEKDDVKELIAIVNDDIKIYKVHNEINNQNGFIITPYDSMYILFDEEIDEYTLQIENVNNMCHFWISIDNEEFYHFGYINSKAEKIICYSNKINKKTIDNNNRSDQLSFRIKDTIDQIQEKCAKIYSLGKKNNWDLDFTNNNYIYFENSIQVDKECALKYVQTPPIALKFNNINIDDFDEIVDIDLLIEAQSNKNNYINDLKINFFKDGDYYIPNNGISSSINYPKTIKNVNKRYTPIISITQPNITICSNCLHTNLGHYDNCPDCNSDSVVHYKEKQKATVCLNCGWIADGWYDKCNYCLSQDIEKVMVDYNKTYCNNCGHLSDKYYHDCPRCFSDDVIHLQNDIHTYEIFDNESQNINPITIQTHDQRINICNIYVPLSSSMIYDNQIEFLNLKIEGTNNIDGKYYYCPSCEDGGLGNYKKCPTCNSRLVYNYEDLNLTLSAYVQYGNTIQKVNFKEGNELTYNENKFIRTIDLKQLAIDNPTTDFDIYVYIENSNYENQKENISKLKISESKMNKILNEVNKIDISIDNISSESKYENEKEWTGLYNIYGQEHTAIKRQEQHSNTEFIEFSDFDFKEYKNLKHAYLYVSGVNKTKKHIQMVVHILNKGYVTSYQTYADSGLFTFEHDIFDVIKKQSIEDIKIQIGFNDSYKKEDINITAIHIKTEKERSKIIYPNIIQNWIINDDNTSTDTEKNNINKNVIKYKDFYRLTSIEDDVWKLNETNPKYLSGKNLETGLICFLDFGALANEEYIRIYDFDLLISYKNKVGTLITRNIPLQKEKADIQSIEGTVLKNNGEIIGTVRQKSTILNNLEYNKFTDTGNEKTLNALPINKIIAQSFKLTNIIESLDDESVNKKEILNINSISGFVLQYFGKVGYPSEILSIYLYDDLNNKPNNKIGEIKYNTKESYKGESIEIPIDQFNISANKTYWLIIEDPKADENNYHRIRYNNNTNIGKLLIEDNGKIKEENNYALSFAVLTSYNVSFYTNLPENWEIDDKETEFEKSFDIYNTFYRYNVQNSNVKVKDLEVKSGYREYW